MSDSRARSEIQQQNDLFVAIESGQLQMVKALSSEKLMFEANIKKNNLTPIAFAAHCGKKEIVMYLFDQWIKPYAPQKNKEDQAQLSKVILYVLKSEAWIKVVKIPDLVSLINQLFECGALDHENNVDEQKENTLHQVMKLGDAYVPILKLLLGHVHHRKQDNKWNHRNQDGKTPLDHALQCAGHQLILTLCQFVDAINEVFIHYDTSRFEGLFFSIKKNQFELFKILISPKYLAYQHVDASRIYTIASYLAHQGHQKELDWTLNLIENHLSQFPNSDDRYQLGMAILLLLEFVQKNPKVFSIQSLENLIKRLFLLGAIDKGKLREGMKTSLHILAELPEAYSGILKLLIAHDRLDKINQVDEQGLVPIAYSTKNQHAAMTHIFSHYPKQIRKENIMILLMNLSTSGFFPTPIWEKIISNIAEYQTYFSSKQFNQILCAGGFINRLQWRFEQVEKAYNASSWYSSKVSSTWFSAIQSSSRQMQELSLQKQLLDEHQSKMNNGVEKKKLITQKEKCVADIQKHVETCRAQSAIFLQKQTREGTLFPIALKYGLFRLKPVEVQEDFVLISGNSKSSELELSTGLSQQYEVGF